MPASASVRICAPAKINLYLGIHRQKDERGYHRVDTVMATLGLADTVEIIPAAGLSVATEPEAGIPVERNTAFRAAVAMGRAFDRPLDAAIHIGKRIPLQSGMGGPSTDAAAVIRGFCALWGIDPTDKRVADVARSIGADVPFFLYGSPAYLAGAGDELRETFELADEMPVVLVKPREGGVSTPGAYARFDSDPRPLPPLEPMLNALRASDDRSVLAHVANNLAPAAIALLPEIGTIAAWLRAQAGVRVVEVSGSGATVFAVCDTPASAEAIARTASSEHGWWSCATKMENSGPNAVIG